jgi:tetratricopeptide (TPR) repeat protein
VAESLHHLATGLRAQDRMEEAVELYDAALAARTRLLGAQHPEVAASNNELAILLMELGKYAEAEPLFRRALETVAGADPIMLSGSERPQYLARAQTSLAAVLVELGNLDEAEGLLSESLIRKRELLEGSHPDVASTLHWLAKLRLRQGNLIAAEADAREALAIRKKTWPGGHPLIASTLSLLGEIVMTAGRPVEAEPLLQESLDLHRTRQPVGHWQTGHALSLLGACLAANGKSSEAEPLLVEGVETLSQARGDADLYTRLAAERAIEFYLQTDRPDHAAVYRARFPQAGS